MVPVAQASLTFIKRLKTGKCLWASQAGKLALSGAGIVFPWSRIAVCVEREPGRTGKGCVCGSNGGAF